MRTASSARAAPACRRWSWRARSIADVDAVQRRAARGARAASRVDLVVLGRLPLALPAARPLRRAGDEHPPRPDPGLLRHRASTATRVHEAVIESGVQGQRLHGPLRRRPVRPRPDHPAGHRTRARRRHARDARGARARARERALPGGDPPVGGGTAARSKAGGCESCRRVARRNAVERALRAQLRRPQLDGRPVSACLGGCGGSAAALAAPSFGAPSLAPGFGAASSCASGRAGCPSCGLPCAACLRRRRRPSARRTRPAASRGPRFW